MRVFQSLPPTALAYVIFPIGILPFDSKFHRQFADFHAFSWNQFVFKENLFIFDPFPRDRRLIVIEIFVSRPPRQPIYQIRSNLSTDIDATTSLWSQTMSPKFSGNLRWNCDVLSRRHGRGKWNDRGDQDQRNKRRHNLFHD